MSRLELLNLEECVDLTDTAMDHIANLTSLTSLNLKGCARISDAGAVSLSEKLKNLKALDVCNCIELSGVAVAAFAKLKCITFSF